MSTKSKLNRTQQKNADQLLIEGLNKHSQTLTPLVIGGTSFTPTAIITVLQQRLAAANTAQSTRAIWQSAVKADLDERAKTKAFMSGLRLALRVAFAGAIDQLADFGLIPPKPRAPRTPQEKAVSVAKAKATRAARHTMGPKQKAEIKGTATPAVPVNSPAAASPTPASGSPLPATAAPAPAVAPKP